MKTPIVTESQWNHYKRYRDLPVSLWFGTDIPSATSLPKVLVDRLYRKWWAQTYFLQVVGQSIRSFIKKKLNDNRTEVRRKTAPRGKQPNASASRHDWESTGPERRQSLAELFGRHGIERTDEAGAIIVDYSNQTFNRVHILVESISFADHSSVFASTAQLRTIDTRRITNLCAYGEPLCDENDVMSLVGAIIVYLPEHARTLLCDDFLPDFQLTCKIRRMDGSFADPIDLEYVRPAGAH
jgi:hypothetical protein